MCFYFKLTYISNFGFLYLENTIYIYKYIAISMGDVKERGSETVSDMSVCI